MTKYGLLKIKRVKSKEKGIKLIALVIKIIVLLILAGVTIATLMGDNGIITKAREAKQKTEDAQKEEEAILSDIEDYMNGITVSEEGFNEDVGVNEPKLKSGMIPVYYDESAKVWKKADETNTGKQWYDYDAKKWANIITVSDEDKELREVEVGTEIPMDKITTFFVWIPRYAYSITEGYKQGSTVPESTEITDVTGEIDVTFLKGNTNTGVDGIQYEIDYDETKLNAGDTTPKIVHPGFTLGNSQLTGIWVAKFEASGLNGEQAVGNASASLATPVEPASDGSTYVRILPNKVSWRHITIGESEYQSMRMSANTEKYGWTGAVNSHLIKNSEWGAVAYLCYSDYGNVPKTNGAGTLDSTKRWYYDMYTGAGAKSDEGRYENFTEDTYGYNTSAGKLASTTGNEYGIYDMAGGAWERVAGYLDNGNNYLNTNGQSTTKVNGETVKYIENGQLNSSYNALWEKYEVSEEERSNQIEVEGVGKIAQTTLWSWNNRGVEYNRARKRLTEANYNNMAKHKGIGVNEVGTDFSYYAPYGTTGSSWSWYKTVKDTSTNTSTEYARAWNSDYTLIGHASFPFVQRGGGCGSGTGAGVLYTGITYGYASNHTGFRPVLAV